MRTDKGSCVSGFPFSSVCVVGLGLMGASLAKALKEALSLPVYGIDRTPEVLKKAKSDHTIDDGAALDDEAGASRLLGQADLTVLCFYPSMVCGFLEKYREAVRPGSLMTDLCGLKTVFLFKAQELCGTRFEYLSVHPMAGREKSGYDASDSELFFGCSFLITPTGKNSSQAVDQMKILAKTIGCGRIRVLSPREHDRIIAYTSHLPHVMALTALMSWKGTDEPASLAGGSFRDATRVADINASLWTELFLDNRQQLDESIDSLKEELDHFQKLLDLGDRTSLQAYLEQAGERKRQWNRRKDEYNE